MVMKRLKELKGIYGHKDIGKLVEFTQKAPIKLPADEHYYFEKNGNVIDIYGTEEGIERYSISGLAAGMSLSGIVTTDEGIEINLSIGGIEKIVLHSEPNDDLEDIVSQNRSSGYSGGGSSSYCGESRNSESRSYSCSSGESRGGGESR